MMKIPLVATGITAQKMKFSIKNFFNKCHQICRKLLIWSHLLRKSLMENFIFCAADAEIDIQRPAQNILAKKWLINSIDKSLDENCYDPHDFGVAEDLSSEF